MGELKKGQEVVFFLFWVEDKDYSPALNVPVKRHTLQIGKNIRCCSLHSKNFKS